MKASGRPKNDVEVPDQSERQPFVAPSAEQVVHEPSVVVSPGAQHHQQLTNKGHNPDEHVPIVDVSSEPQYAEPELAEVSQPFVARSSDYAVGQGNGTAEVSMGFVPRSEVVSAPMQEDVPMTTLPLVIWIQILRSI